MRKTSLAHRHHVGVVTKNGEPLAGKRARRDMENRGRELAGDLVHVGDHQQQSLGSGKGGGQPARLQGAVDGACCPTLTLHLHHPRHSTPEVGLAIGRPFIRKLPHIGRRGDRINGDNFVGKVGDTRGGLVTVDSDRLGLRHNEPLIPIATDNRATE